MVRHAPIHRRSGHSDIAICCGRNVRGSSPSTSVVPLSNQVTTLNHKRFKGFKMFSDGHSEFRDSYLSRNSPHVEPPRADVFSGPTTSSDRRAAEQRDELAAVHSITSSARASSVSGTVRPSALAVLRLITNSYLVGACTGRSAGFSPLRMRST